MKCGLSASPPKRSTRAARLALRLKQPDQHRDTARRVKRLPVGRALHHEVRERSTRVLDAVCTCALPEHLTASNVHR